MWVGNHENYEDNSGSYKQGVECWISVNDGNRGNNSKPRDSGVQTTGSPNNGFKIMKQKIS